MKEVALYEAKTRLSELLDAVEQGEQILITRRGQPIAKLIAANAGRRATSQRQRVASVFAYLRQHRKGITLDGDIREIVAAGRD